MTEGDLAALESTDTEKLVAAAGLAVRSLRTHAEVDLLDLTSRLVALYQHDDYRVRLHVAEACEFLPDPMGESALTRLREDHNGYVQRAAARSTERRAAQKKKRHRDTERGRSVRDLLEQIGEKNKGTQRIAERAVRLAEEGVARALHHEVSKSVTPLEQSILAIFEESAKPRPDLARIAREAAKARGRITLHRDIVDSLGVYSGRVKPKLAEEDVGALVDAALGQLASRFRTRTLDVTRDVPQGLTVDAQRSGLLQAFQNVLENCVEAHGDSASVVIRVSARALLAGSQIAIAFEDRGAGMTEAEQRAMFDGRTSKEGGSGIGQLVIRKTIEQVHGGSIAVESEVGKGTTVTITLPVRQRGRGNAKERHAER